MPLTPKLADCFDFVFVGNWILKNAWEFLLFAYPTYTGSRIA